MHSIVLIILIVLLDVTRSLKACDQSGTVINNTVNESVILNINCCNGSILIKDAFYGQNDYNCSSPFAFNVSSSICNNRSSCSLTPSNTLFIKDPCIRIPKYAIIQHECVEETSTTTTTTTIKTSTSLNVFQWSPWKICILEKRRRRSDNATFIEIFTMNISCYLLCKHILTFL